MGFIAGRVRKWGLGKRDQIVQDQTLYWKVPGEKKAVKWGDGEEQSRSLRVSFRDSGGRKFWMDLRKVGGEMFGIADNPQDRRCHLIPAFRVNPAKGFGCKK